jgi:hypothetical protein
MTKSRKTPQILQCPSVEYDRHTRDEHGRALVVRNCRARTQPRLSPTSIARLIACWEKEYASLRERDLTGREYVCVWV